VCLDLCKLIYQLVVALNKELITLYDIVGCIGIGMELSLG